MSVFADEAALADDRNNAVKTSSTPNRIASRRNVFRQPMTPLAKVTRDRLMEEYDHMFPEYGFASNKGYGSAEHIAALKKYGPTPIHRKSFIKNFL